MNLWEESVDATLLADALDAPATAAWPVMPIAGGTDLPVIWSSAGTRVLLTLRTSAPAGLDVPFESQ